MNVNNSVKTTTVINNNPSRKHARTTSNTNNDDLQRTTSDYNRSYADAARMNRSAPSTVPPPEPTENGDTRSESTQCTEPLDMDIDTTDVIALSNTEQLVVQQIKSGMIKLFNNAITKRKHMDIDIDKITRSIERLQNHVNNNTYPKSYGTAMKLQLKNHTYFSHIQSFYEQQFNEIHSKLRDEELTTYKNVLQELLNQRQTHIRECCLQLIVQSNTIIDDYNQLFDQYNSIFNVNNIKRSVHQMILNEINNRIHLYEIISIKRKQAAQHKLKLQLERDARAKEAEQKKREDINNNPSPTIRDQIAIEVQKQLKTILAQYKVTKPKQVTTTVTDTTDKHDKRGKPTSTRKSHRRDTLDNTELHNSTDKSNGPKKSQGGRQNPKSRTTTVSPPSKPNVVQDKPNRRQHHPTNTRGTGNRDHNGKGRPKPFKVSSTLDA